MPYDLSMSPLENLFDHPDDLDPQPEYPLRQKGVAPVKNAEVADVISDVSRISIDLTSNYALFIRHLIFCTIMTTTY